MHPDSLRLSEDQIEQQVAGILESFGYGSGHIFNLGHGIKPDIDPEKVSVLVNAVASFSKKYH